VLSAKPQAISLALGRNLADTPVKNGGVVMLRKLALFVLVLAGMVLAVWFYFRPTAPDAFYDFAATDSAPGTLLTQDVFVRNIPAGTKAWRILYQTTRSNGSKAIASALVVVPENTQKPAPIIAWAHGTTGVARGCAPSLFENPFPHIPAFPELFQQGWAFVATDYVGQGTSGGHAYLIGDDAARNVLDAIRAAHMLPTINLSDEALIWGHSQGGNSALWSGQLAPTYAPDIKLLGVAALAPASDLVGLVEKGKSTMFGKIVSAFVVESYTRDDATLSKADLLQPGISFWLNDIAGRCVGGYETLLSAVETMALPKQGIFKPDALQGPFLQRLKDNSPRKPISAPVFIAQGLADDLVWPDVQAAFVEKRCTSGQPLEYKTYDGLDHLSLVAATSPLSQQLLQWSKDRFSAQPFTPNCPP
jgi:alpha-beta hydrolase superfamily lysophospholipase